MQIAKLVELKNKKAQIEAKKTKIINKQLNKKRIDKVNLDESSIKRGYIEKVKLIDKKKYDTIFEKARIIPIEIQDNANPNTYL